MQRGYEGNLAQRMAHLSSTDGQHHLGNRAFGAGGSMTQKNSPPTPPQTGGRQRVKTVAIIGAGPVGLAAGAHALERGLSPVILELGPEAGHSVRQWQHVQLFSPWQFNVDLAAERLLKEVGWKRPEDQRLPTGGDFLDAYLVPLAERTRLADYLRLSTDVIGVTRQGHDKLRSAGRDRAPFEVRVRTKGVEDVFLADAVIDASGTWATPNPAGANGLPAFGEREASERISYGMPDVLGAQRQRFANRRVAVLGGGHSAVGTILDLVSLSESAAQTTMTWLVRAQDTARSFGGGENDQLRARGQIGARFRHLVEGGKIAIESGFRVNRLSMAQDGLQIWEEGDTERRITVDELVVATGFRPDFSLTRELRLNLDATVECPPVLAPLIDPNLHSCGTVPAHGARELAHPEPGFYVVGMKSYGRAPTFLMITGYEQVRSVMAELAGDSEAAAKVELQLPETGVCSAPLDAEDETGCCEPNMTKNQPSVRLNLDRNRQL